jgi:N-acetylglutamate synthase-like GNAT family acetyltransferase
VVDLGAGGILRRARSGDARAVARLVRDLGWTLRGRRGMRGPYGGWEWGMMGCLGAWVGIVVAQGGWAIAGVAVGIGALLWGLMVWFPLISWSEYWVVEVRGRVVACAKLYEGDCTSELYDVFVVRGWRGFGFGRALVLEAIATARYPVYLASLPDAIGFYEGLGFRVVKSDRLDAQLRGRLSLENPQYQKLGLTPMMRERR